MERFSRTGTWVCWQNYYAGCDLHQPRLLSKAILWECQNATAHCSIHIKSLLLASLWRSESSIQCWKDDEYIYDLADTGIRKITCETDFLLNSQGRDSPELSGDGSDICVPVSKKARSLFMCPGRVKDTVKYSLPKLNFTSCLDHGWSSRSRFLYLQ